MLELCYCIYSVFLGLFTEIVYFSVYFRNNDDLLQLKKLQISTLLDKCFFHLK